MRALAEVPSNRILQMADTHLLNMSNIAHLVSENFSCVRRQSTVLCPNKVQRKVYEKTITELCCASEKRRYRNKAYLIIDVIR